MSTNNPDYITINMKTTYLRINPADNVAVAISPLHTGETIEADGRVITLRTDVPAGHKVTLKNFQAGENIIKYGYPIGHVTTDVPEGTWVSEKEIKTCLLYTSPSPRDRG